MDDIRKAAKKFVKKLDGKKVTVESLENYIESEGYIILEYLPGKSDNKITNLLCTIGKYDYAQNISGFCYIDNSRKILFIRKHLSYRDKLSVLSHESGHICFKHPIQNGIFVSDVTQEDEANTFSQLIRHKPNNSNNIIAILATFASFILLTTAILITNIPKRDKIYHENIYKQYNVIETEYDSDYDYFYSDNYVYITRTGKKYHLPTCRYSSKNATAIKLSEALKLCYEPCKDCRPDMNL